MSNSLMINEYDENNMFNEDDNLNQTPSYINNSYLCSNPSMELNTDEFYKHYIYLCKFCEGVPDLNISKKGKISYTCKCEKKYKDLSIKKFYENLFYSKDIYSENDKLKCHLHNEKYTYCCKECFSNDCNYCIKCSSDCQEHKNELIMFGIDDNDIKEKADYIIKEIEDKDNIKNCCLINQKEEIIIINNDLSHNIIENDEDDENKLENNDEIINIINESNFGIYDGDDYNINLLKIIINDYENFPNYNHLKTISNIEKFASLYFIDYNVIYLSYKFEEKNITNNSKIKLFGDEFVDNNKENCFLIINECLIDLDRYINLEEIFDEIPTERPLYLDVKLIERKRKVMTNLSFMFNEISTISDKSNFDNYNSTKIRNMSNMFYNCKSLKNLPNISKLRTENITDMSYMFYNCYSRNVIDMNFMFYNCSSLIILSDISK